MLEILLIAVVVIAVITDLTANKIYNPLCLFALISGITLHWIDANLLNALLALAAALAAGAIFLPFYVMGGMAAGDVKLMAATAAIMGWPSGVMASGVSLMCGTVLGMVYFFARGGAKEFVSRYCLAVKHIWFTGRPYLPEAAEGSVSQSRFPYALAIASGCLITQFYSRPLINFIAP